MTEKKAHTDKIVDCEYQEFTNLFIEYHPRIRHFIGSLVKSDAVANDLSQDIFVKIWTHRALWPRIKSFDAYIYQMARNAAKDYIKGSVIRCVHQGKIQWLHDKLVLPDEEYDMKETELLVRMLVDEMPEQRKRIFEMSRFGGLKNDEIAERLGISKKTVENHINMALTHVRNGLPILLISLILGRY